MELDNPSFDFVPSKDDRPVLPVPPPVTVVAIADVSLPCQAGRGAALDDFYLGVLGFEPDDDPDRPAYWADNVRVVFEVFESDISRDGYRPLQLVVRDLERVRLGLIERKIDFSSTQRLYTSDEMILTSDPAENYVEIVEYRPLL